MRLFYTLVAALFFIPGPSALARAALQQSTASALTPVLQSPPGSVALFRILEPGSGLQIPMDVVSKPGDDRLYIVDMAGTVRVWEEGALQPAPFLDVTSRIRAAFPTGLRGMAFHPLYDINGYVYVSYDFDDAAGAIHFGIARMQRSASNPDQIDPNSFAELLREPQFIIGHSSSRLVFGRDGMLYAALGDGGLRDDPACNAQNHQRLMGSMIRIDVDGAFPYAIPADNPFLSDPNVRNESWQLGMRHPWKWSFDALNGDLWIGDVGNDRWEEIDWVPAGQGGHNFGWSVMEANECFALSSCPPTSLPCGDPGYTAPVYAYDHSVGCSIVGGFVYRGSALPEWWGRYVFSDFCTSNIWSLSWDGSQTSDFQDHSPGLVSLNGGTLTQPFGIAQDSRGELLVMDFADKEIYRFVRDCHVQSFCPQSSNSTGQAAELTWSGLPSLQNAPLVLHASGMPVGTIGHVFYSPARTSTPLASSTLCVQTTHGYFRLHTYMANSAGRGHTRLDYAIRPIGSGPGQVLAGTTWYFQAWFRDQGAPLGLESSLSNALRVDFCP